MAALLGVDLDVHAGELVVTTLLSILGCILTASSGRLGRRIAAKPRRIKSLYAFPILSADTAN